mmetsp:Transcript_102588/g.289858  ORF Transcript_102588/g.289858 Transcript_102588/m.289858 type:complete len:215 (-) Transcript_102588:842-1486(-)
MFAPSRHGVAFPHARPLLAAARWKPARSCHRGQRPRASGFARLRAWRLHLARGATVEGGLAGGGVSVRAAPGDVGRRGARIPGLFLLGGALHPHGRAGPKLLACALAGAVSRAAHVRLGAVCARGGCGFAISGRGEDRERLLAAWLGSERRGDRADPADLGLQLLRRQRNRGRVRGLGPLPRGRICPSRARADRCGRRGHPPLHRHRGALPSDS